AGGIAGLAWIVHWSGRAGVAAAGDAVVLADRLAGNLAAGVENALDHGRIDVGDVSFENAGADHHRHAGEADIVLERHPAAGKLAARTPLDRRLHVPGAVAIFLRARTVGGCARIFHRRQLVGHAVERGIGAGQRRDDLLGGAEIIVARI